MDIENQGKDWAKRASKRSGQAIAYIASAPFSPQLAAWKFRLANGLRVILASREGCPVFAYQTWYGVGSRDEDPGRTGMAHFFEHLMFKGTKRFPTGVFDREMEKRGSQTNAATWVDWTYYTQALASSGDNLRTVIDFESDRMTGLILDENTFRSELDVVKNERRMAVDSSPSGELQEKLYALAFQTHPYQWPTLGSMSHLESACIDDLEAFYHRFYVPNNATVVIAGGVDPEEALSMISEAYGQIASVSIERRAYEQEPMQVEPRFAQIARQTASPILSVAYKSAALGTSEHLKQELLGELAGAGDTARLYQRLVLDEGIASDVHTFVTPFADPGLFEVSVSLVPDADVHEATEMIQEELEALAAGVSADEYDKVQNSTEMEMVEAFRDIEQLAESLGHHETSLNDFSRAFSHIHEVRGISRDQLEMTAKSTFVINRRTTMVCLPEADV